MRKVKVQLGERSYSIVIGESLLPRLGAECRRLGDQVLSSDWQLIVRF